MGECFFVSPLFENTTLEIQSIMNAVAFTLFAFADGVLL